MILPDVCQHSLSPQCDRCFSSNLCSFIPIHLSARSPRGHKLEKTLVVNSLIRIACVSLLGKWPLPCEISSAYSVCILLCSRFDVSFPSQYILFQPVILSYNSVPSATVPSQWSAVASGTLPVSVTSAPSLAVFRSRLKSYLFERSFPADSYWYLPPVLTSDSRLAVF